MVAVDADALFKIMRICFGMKLCGIDVLAMPDHLDRTAIGVQQMHGALRQGLNCFLVADKNLKLRIQTFQQRVCRCIGHLCANRWPHRFTILRLADLTPQMVRQNAQAVTAAHERVIICSDLRHQLQDLCLYPRFLL